MKSVLVTGGTVRLGKAIAERLRAEGWRVITSSHRADAGADIVADLTEPTGATKLYAATLQMLGGMPPDALVNNAALFTGDAAAIKAVNFEAPKKLTMLMAGRETGMGAVVNVLDSVAVGSLGSLGSLGALGASGAAGFLGSTGSSGALESTLNDPKRPYRPYLDSKRELLSFTRTSAATFAATLRVNAVAPGPVLAPTEVHEKAGEMLLERRPTPDDVAAAVSYLLGAESVTGVVIPVDAGQHLLKCRHENLCGHSADNMIKYTV